MCLAVPAKVIKVMNQDEAEVEYMGTRKMVKSSLVPGVIAGQWVLVHAGYAIEIVEEEYAAESLKLWREMTDEMGDVEKL